MPINQSNSFVDQPQLIVQGKNGVQTVQLREQKCWSLGRSPQNLIHLADRFASRFHAKLEVLEERHWYYFDLNSRNGSLLNGQPIHEPALLKHGDRIVVGHYNLTFRHNFITLHALAAVDTTPRVLMLQLSATQGKIWQEIFLSQGIDTAWEVPGTDLQQVLNLSSATQQLPQVLLLDIQAYSSNLAEFCQWCRAHHPALKLLLTDSKGSRIAPQNQAQAQAWGCVNLLPAFPPQDLLNQSVQIVDQVTVLLQSFKGVPLQRPELLDTLWRLQRLFNEGVAQLHSVTHQDIDDQEDPTSLNLKADPSAKV